MSILQASIANFCFDLRVLQVLPSFPPQKNTWFMSGGMKIGQNPKDGSAFWNCRWIHPYLEQNCDWIDNSHNSWGPSNYLSVSVCLLQLLLFRWRFSFKNLWRSVLHGTGHCQWTTVLSNSQTFDTIWSKPFQSSARTVGTCLHLGTNSLAYSLHRPCPHSWYRKRCVICPKGQVL